MGTISIWHWIIVLVFLGAPVIAIAAARPGKTLTRMPYFWRIAGLLVAGFAMGLLKENAASGDTAATVAFFALGALFVSVAIGVLSALWSVHRIQDIGASKWWCLLLLVPVVNLIYIAFLIFYPGHGAGDLPAQST